MWLLLVASLGLAETPVGLEGGLGVAMPHAGLGPAVGIRALGEVEVVDALWVGGEGDLRFPGGATTDLDSPDMLRPIEIRTGQTALSLGARVGFTPGDRDGLRWRVAAAVGATRLIQAVKSDAGTTREAASALWLRPEGGAVLALGPGFLTPSLYWSVSPTRLDTLGGAGNVLGVMIGYRGEL